MASCASPSPSKCSLQTTSYSTHVTKLSPSLSFRFHLPLSKGHRLILFSLRNSSSSSSSTPNPSGEVRKSLNSSISSSRKPSGPGNDPKSEVDLVCSNRDGAQKKQTISFKALFGRKTSWRRISSVSSKVRSIILLNVITMVYASNIPILKEVEAVTDPAAFTVVRFVVSAIPFIPFVLRAWDDVGTRNSGMELGVWVSLGYLMQALGMLTSDAGRASFISMLTVIVVPLLDGMLGTTIPALTWFGALMSIIGVAMLESSGSPPSIGDLLNFLSAVFFGVHMLRTERISRSTNKKQFLPLLGYEVCVIAIFSTIWYFVGGWFGGIQSGDPSSWTWPVIWHWIVTFPWIPALYTGIFSTGLCLWIEMDAMRNVSATETAIIYALEPVWGGGLAWFLLGERWDAYGWIGAAFVLGGSLTVQIFGSSPASADEDEEKSEKADHLLVSDTQHGFSTAPDTVRSRKDVPTTLKK